MKVLAAFGFVSAPWRGSEPVNQSCFQESGCYGIGCDEQQYHFLVPVQVMFVTVNRIVPSVVRLMRYTDLEHSRPL